MVYTLSQRQCIAPQNPRNKVAKMTGIFCTAYFLAERMMSGTVSNTCSGASLRTRDSFFKKKTVRYKPYKFVNPYADYFDKHDTVESPKAKAAEKADGSYVMILTDVTRREHLMGIQAPGSVGAAVIAQRKYDTPGPGAYEPKMVYPSAPSYSIPKARTTGSLLRPSEEPAVGTYDPRHPGFRRSPSYSIARRLAPWKKPESTPGPARYAVESIACIGSDKRNFQINTTERTRHRTPELSGNQGPVSYACSSADSALLWPRSPAFRFGEFRPSEKIDFLPGPGEYDILGALPHVSHYKRADRPMRKSLAYASDTPK